MNPIKWPYLWYISHLCLFILKVPLAQSTVQTKVDCIVRKSKDPCVVYFLFHSRLILLKCFVRSCFVSAKGAMRLIMYMFI